MTDSSHELRFILPGPLRDVAGDRDVVAISGSVRSVGQALSLLWEECPGVRDRVLTERGELRPHVNIFVDGESIRYAGGLQTPIRNGSEIVILPAVSGG